MSDIKPYMTLTEFAQASGHPMGLLDRVATNCGGKRYHKGFGCEIYDTFKVLANLIKDKPEKPEPEDPTKGRRYVDKCELAYILKTDPQTAAEIGEAAGARIDQAGEDSELYDRELVEKYRRVKKC